MNEKEMTEEDYKIGEETCGFYMQVTKEVLYKYTEILGNTLKVDSDKMKAIFENYVEYDLDFDFTMAALAYAKHLKKERKE